MLSAFFVYFFYVITMKQSFVPVPLPEERISALERAGGLVALLGSASGATLLRWLRRKSAGRFLAAAASLTGLAGVFWVFRNPPRRIPAVEDAILAPCDGTVQTISIQQEERFLHAPAQQVTIRINLGDVPLVRAPGQGAVQYRCLELVSPEQPTTVGESLWLGIRQPQGTRVLMQLTARAEWQLLPTWMAQPITALVDLEDAVGRGQVTAHLALGGVVRLYLPAGMRLAVAPGDRVRGGETVMGTRK